MVGSRRALLLGSILSLAFAGAASAQSVFMLQLGSFDSRGKAESHWTDLKKKYGSELGSAESRISEVQLPPDNVKVYRTQAGPIASREQAQGICGSLTGGGDECYIVETAMAGETPASASFTGGAQAEPSVQQASAARAMPPVPPLPVEPTPAVAPQPAPSDMSNMQPIPPMEAMNSADGDSPMARQQERLAAVEAPVAASERRADSRRSFWSAINPFSEDEAAQAPAPAPTPTAAPAAAASPVDASEQAVPAPVVETPSDLPPPVKQARAMPPVPPVAAPVQESAPAMASAPFNSVRSGRLLPPPPQPVNAPQAWNAPAPAAAAPVIAPVPANAGGEANVEVEDAIRVPLSGTPTLQPVPFGNLPTASQLAAKGYPSQVAGRTLWAQLGYFQDQQSALAMWDEFRQSHPEFPVVRVRVTQPYRVSSMQRGNTSLRVGPFDKPAAIQQLCAAFAESGLRCTIVRDLGDSSTANMPRSRQPFAVQGYTNTPSIGFGGARLSYIHLGSYRSLNEAEMAWSQLKGGATTAAMLSRAQPYFTAPAMGSAAPLYRLRTGPYSNRVDAVQSCNQLQMAGVTCAVVDQ